MTGKFRFLNWEVYRDAKKVFSIILKLVHKLPAEYRFELGNQITRSGLSIVLNIAEGSGKSSDAELNRFINISLGSVYETVAAIDVFYENKLIEQEQSNNLNERLASIASQLGGFKRKLKKSQVISKKL
jgi:four helix bundle protein